MRKFLLSIFIVLALGWSMLFASAAGAAVTLPWSTTYNCPEWKQSDGLPSCDGLWEGGGWTCDNGDSTVREEQITAVANYPSGGGGKGQRHWLGDGANNVSGGMRIAFTAPQPELWIRWYMRYESGFLWGPLNNQKWLIVNNLAQNRTIVGFTWSDETRIEVTQYGGNYNSGPGYGWQTVMGGTASDGNWHRYEAHIKTDTNGTNGIAELWIDGVMRLSYSNAYFGSVAFDDVLIASNSRDPLNGRCMAVDFDDLAIRTTGPIGPVGPGDTLAPAAPTNLTVQ